jgi:hypothetical protein
MQIINFVTEVPQDLKQIELGIKVKTTNKPMPFTKLNNFRFAWNDTWRTRRNFG